MAEISIANMVTRPHRLWNIYILEGFQTRYMYTDLHDVGASIWSSV